MTKRRDFIKDSILGTAGLAIGGVGFSPKSYGSIIGSNDRINIAVIGIRNHGSEHIKNWCNLGKSHNVHLKTLCDADENLFPSRSKMVFEAIGTQPLTVWDMRKIFDDQEIDAVSFAVPNHWHALGTIWACQAGKHVYVEKPASHNIWEGRKMIEAAKKYKVHVQVGLNRRSSDNVMSAVEFLHNGGIGEVYMARALCLKTRDSYGISADSEPPVNFHYDQWLGPAPWRPYNEKKGHYCWHWYWDTGNGDMGNTGPHRLDISRWGMNMNEHPVSVFSTGGVFGFDTEENPSGKKTPGVMVYGDVETYGHDKTSQETPNTQTAVFKYRDGKIIQCEVRGRYTNHEGSPGNQAANLFYGTEGFLEIYDNADNSWRAFRRREKDHFKCSEDFESAWQGTHYSNFIDVLREGNYHKLHCNINEGFYSSALPLLANISYRLGRHLNFMGEYENFINDPEANTLLSRKYRFPYIVPDKV